MLGNQFESAQTPSFPESNFYNPFGDLLKLTPGKRYTLMLESTFGTGTHTIHITLHSVRPCRFDNHENCLEVFFKPRGKTKICQILFYGAKAFAVWEGWLDIAPPPEEGILTTLGFHKHHEKRNYGRGNGLRAIVHSIPLSPVCCRMQSDSSPIGPH
ncbi:MAG: hypothetical protein ACAH59_13690 [Pseudobdellovibrionaceae bacterium]